MRIAWLALAALLPSACSPSDDGGSTPSCSAFDAGPKGDAGKTVARAEIDEIFRLSCSFSSCHGEKPGKGDLYLPLPAAGDWHPNVVNVPSKIHKTMKLVVPFDPQNSFLVHKLTDGSCALAKDCVSGTCGDRMPQGSDPLPPAQRDAIVEWIRAGAPQK